MNPLERKELDAYLTGLKRVNVWFDQKSTVRLTHEQLLELVSHAYLAGFRCEAGNSLFDQVFGKMGGGE